MGEEIDIVQEILSDREKGTARLVAEYRDRLYSAAFALCHDAHEAEDLVFCTLERVLSKISLYKERESFYEWMYVILLNIYRNSVRGKMACNTIPVGGPQELDILAEPQTVDYVTASVDGDMVRQFLEKMPDNMREVLLLRYFMDMPVSQIAKFLALPLGTIKSRLHYARIALAHHFGANVRRVAMTFAAAVLLLVASAAAYSIFGNAGTDADETAEVDGNSVSISSSIHQGEQNMTRNIAAAALSAAMVAAPITAGHALASSGAAVTSEAICVRGSAEACIWQTVFNETTINWHWPETATKAVLEVTRHGERSSTYEILRADGEKWGSCAEALPSASDGIERLSSLSISFFAGESAIDEVKTAKVAALPGRIHVYSMNSPEFLKVNCSTMRLVPCIAGTSLAMTPHGGASVNVRSPVEPGYNPFRPRDVMNWQGVFTLTLDDVLASPFLMCFRNGMNISIR